MPPSYGEVQGMQREQPGIEGGTSGRGRSWGPGNEVEVLVWEVSTEAGRGQPMDPGPDATGDGGVWISL